MRLALGRAVDAGLSVAAGRARCAGGGGDAPPGRAVSAVRVSPDPDLLEARGPRDEHRSHASALAPGRPAGAAASASSTRGDRAGHGRCRRPRINHVWAYDFVFDTCANGQTLKCLTIVDEWTRECLAIDVAGGIRSGRVIEVLDAARERPRRAALSALGQRAGVRGRRDSALARRRAASTPR